MCGRFANHVQDMHRWASVLRDWPAQVAGGAPVAPTGFNIAPSQQVPVVCASGVYAMRWGLVPTWSKEPSTSYATFNARLETVAEKPAYRGAWAARRRCLVPIMGYYEWLQVEDGKQPYYVSAAGGLVMAGLWEQRDTLLSFTVLTEPAQAHMTELHLRMPVFAAPENAEGWLNGSYDFSTLATDELRASLEYAPVSRRVNSVKNQGEELIAPLLSDGD